MDVAGLKNRVALQRVKLYMLRRLELVSNATVGIQTIFDCQVRQIKSHSR